MPSIEMSVPHQLSQPEAVQRIQSLLQNIKTQHSDKISNLKEEWNGNTGSFGFTAMGFNVSGLLTINESSVDLNGNLPFAATFFQGKIKSIIREQAEKVLAK